MSTTGSTTIEVRWKRRRRDPQKAEQMRALLSTIKSRWFKFREPPKPIMLGPTFNKGTPLPKQHNGGCSSPKFQQFFHFTETSGKWSSMTPTPPILPVSKELLKSLHMVSYNVDYSGEYPKRRLKAAIDHLSSLQSLQSLANPLILIQELNEDCFGTLLASPTIRSKYALSNISRDAWPSEWYSSYGTVTLIPRWLIPHISSMFRTTFTNSTMDRDALYVDILCETNFLEGSESAQQNSSILRVANVHLESLGEGTRTRPKQLRAVHDFLTCDDVRAGIVAGDMNAIRPDDEQLPQRLGFNDAWVLQSAKVSGKPSDDEELLRKVEEDPDGHTWGYQISPGRFRFSPARLDKILYVGAVSVLDLERVGTRLMLRLSDERREEDHLESLDDEDTEDIWVSDHYGLRGRIDVSHTQEIE